MRKKGRMEDEVEEKGSRREEVERKREEGGGFYLFHIYQTA